MPDQQMRSELPRYPVDRYLVESSKKVEMVNIIEDDIWNSEPALRPEDEIILRKLHEMLKSTADDLKLLSGELSKYHEPGLQAKSLPTPLDEEFNEKVHIEEIVNAKFHGHKICEKPSPFHDNKIRNDIKEREFKTTNNINKHKVNAGVQVNPPILKKHINSKLTMSRTKVIQIDEKIPEDSKEPRLNNDTQFKNSSAVTYNEFCYKYNEPKDNTELKKVLQLQNMPSINIRSELTEQKVLHLDIYPEDHKNKQIIINKSNVAVLAMKHEPCIVEHKNPSANQQLSPRLETAAKVLPIRKISKISTCESSESTNNVSSDAQRKLKPRKLIKIPQKISPKRSSRIEDKTNKKSAIDNKPVIKKSQHNLDEWKKKLNIVYGQSANKSKISTKSKTNIKKESPNKNTLFNQGQSSILNNNANYIPYSLLTVGGVRVSDIEKEISDIPNKNEVPLSPILDRILNSRENSFNKDTSEEKNKILNTSDENLLQEVIDIERRVKKTLSKNDSKWTESEIKSPDIFSEENENGDAESYPDDFEDEKSDPDEVSIKQTRATDSDSDASGSNNTIDSDHENNKSDSRSKKRDIHNSTYIKKPNLSFKDKVDIYEYVHSIDTHDNATQSTHSQIQKISLKETQTSPRNESSMQPIHNDLWPSIDPKGEVQKMFELEKDLIKNIIIEEYGDLLEKNITKPSSSKDRELEDTQNNVASFQKNTQTSPAHVKSVMTSPTKMKTRTTSPFTLSVPINRQTSPIVCVTSEEDLKQEIENAVEDLGISINLSSPRFSLRLPQTSREVLSNFEDSQTSKEEQKQVNQVKRLNVLNKITISSSSSVDADNSSSEISSLGEVKFKLKRRLRKSRVSTISDSSCSSILSKYSSDLQSMGILPLRSEGEISLGQSTKKKSSNRKESDGETSLGRLG